MPGLIGIKEQRQREREQNSNQSGPRQLWLREDDVATVAILPSGLDDDPRLGDYYVHTTPGTRPDGSKFWKTILCQRKMNDAACAFCENKDYASHKFIMWVYVYHIDHPEQNEDNTWEEVRSVANVKRYRQQVKEFRLWTHGYGKDDALLNQLVDIVTEQGPLDQFAIKIKRNGGGKNTTYSVTRTGTENKSQMPTEAVEYAKKLQPVMECAVEMDKRWNTPKESSNVDEEKSSQKTTTASSTIDDDVDLF